MAVSTLRRGGLVHERAGGPTEWYTPPRIFAALKIRFDLDPCSPGPAVVPWIPVHTHYTRADDGLTKPWYGRIWLNPPYGRGVDRWLERFAEHRNGIALIFARTDTEWFHRYAAFADAICFTRGRILFVSPTGPTTSASSPGCGSVLLAHGDHCVVALRKSGLGLTLNLRAHREARSRTTQGFPKAARHPLRIAQKAQRS